MKLVHKKRWSNDGWEVTSNKGETYKMWFFLGKVEFDGNDGTLLVIGNLYLVWKVIS